MKEPSKATVSLPDWALARRTLPDWVIPSMYPDFSKPEKCQS